MADVNSAIATQILDTSMHVVIYIKIKLSCKDEEWIECPYTAGVFRQKMTTIQKSG